MDNKINKVYCVFGTDSPSYGDSTWLMQVFTNKDDAERYAEDQEKMDEYDAFYVMDYDLLTEYKDPQLTKYFITYGFIEESLDILKDNAKPCEDPELDMEWKPYQGESYVKIENDCVEAGSLNNFEEAAKLMLNEVERLQKDKEQGSKSEEK